MVLCACVAKKNLNMLSSERQHEGLSMKPLGVSAWGNYNFICNCVLFSNEGQRSTCSWPQHPCENGDGCGLSCPILAYITAMASMINQLISFHSQLCSIWDHMIAATRMAKMTSLNSCFMSYEVLPKYKQIACHSTTESHNVLGP